MSDSESKFEIELEAPPMQDFGAEQLSGLESNEGSLEDRMRGELATRCLELLARDLDFRDFTRELLTLMMKCFQCEAGSILEFDQAAHQFFFRASAGTVSDKLPNFTIPQSKGIVGRAFSTRECIYVGDARENQDHLKSIGMALGFEVQNLVAAPLLIRGQGFGVLELINLPTEVAGEDLALLGALSRILSKTLEIRLMLAWAIRRAKSQSGLAA